MAGKIGMGIGNVKAQLGNPRTRLVFFGTFALIFVVMVVAWLIFVRKSNSAEQQLASAVAAPPQAQSSAGTPDQQTSAEYDRLVAQNNAKMAEEALNSGGSAIPAPRAGAAASDIQIGPQPIASNPTTSPNPSAAPPPETATSQQQADQARQQAYEQAVQQRMQAMAKQMGSLQKYWTVQPHVSERLAPQPAQQQTSQAGASASSNTVATVKKANADIRAGDVKYAQLDTGVNTDDPDAPGQVMATIHESGKFRGARLFGKLEQGDQYSKTVGFHFTRMSVTGESVERTIDAWAIDPNTSRPAMASEVNNHYLSRGASIFIGSFLEGYSEGLLKGGQNQSVVTNGNSVTVQTDAYTNKQLVEIGVGNVGKRVASGIGQAANRPKTILVDRGLDMGIWFIQESAPGDTSTTPSLLDATSAK